MKAEIDTLNLNLSNAFADDAEISDQYLEKLERDVMGVASMFDFNLKDKFLKQLSQENQKLKAELQNSKKKDIFEDKFLEKNKELKAVEIKLENAEKKIYKLEMKMQNEADQKEKLMIERKNDQKTFAEIKTKNEL